MTAASRSTTSAIPGIRCTRTASCATAAARRAASPGSFPPAPADRKIAGYYAGLDGGKGVGCDLAAVHRREPGRPERRGAGARGGARLNAGGCREVRAPARVAPRDGEGEAPGRAPGALLGSVAELGPGPCPALGVRLSRNLLLPGLLSLLSKIRTALKPRGQETSSSVAPLRGSPRHPRMAMVSARSSGVMSGSAGPMGAAGRAGAGRSARGAARGRAHTHRVRRRGSGSRAYPPVKGGLWSRMDDMTDPGSRPARPEVAVAIVTSDLGVLVGRRRDGTPPLTFPGGARREPGGRRGTGDARGDRAAGPGYRNHRRASAPEDRGDDHLRGRCAAGWHRRRGRHGRARRGPVGQPRGSAGTDG